MWTTTLWGALYTAVLLGFAYILHAYIGIRRTTPDRATAFRTFGDWLKARWDWAAAIVIAGLPIAWSMALDSFVIIANAIATIIPQVGGIDLSKLMLGDKVKEWLPLAALAAPVIRDTVEKLAARLKAKG